MEEVPKNTMLAQLHKRRCSIGPLTLNGASIQKRTQVNTMKKHIKLPAALCVAAIAALLLSALALTIKPMVEHRHEADATLSGTNIGRVGISDPAFYAEMASVNTRMHEGMEI